MGLEESYLYIVSQIRRRIVLLILLIEIIQGKGQYCSNSSQSFQSLSTLMIATQYSCITAFFFDLVHERHPPLPSTNYLTAEQGVTDQKHPTSSPNCSFLHRLLYLAR